MMQSMELRKRWMMFLFKCGYFLKIYSLFLKGLLYLVGAASGKTGRSKKAVPIGTAWEQ
jgi:hypothetical protein